MYCEFRNLNLHGTLYLNLKLLDIKDALKFPILVYGKLDVYLGSKVCFEINVPIRRGLLEIGSMYEKIVEKRQASNFNIHGKIILNGYFKFARACSVSVDNGAVLELGDNSSLGSKSSLTCSSYIKFARSTRVGTMSWISDSNSHFILDMVTKKVKRHIGNVILGNYNFIGAKSFIMAGTRTPDYTIISSSSFCNKDYTMKVSPFSVLGGIPAKVVAENRLRIFDVNKELEISQYFKENPNEEFFILNNIDDVLNFAGHL